MQSWILLALPQVLEAKSQRLLQLLCHGKGLVPRGGGQRPRGGQGGMLLLGLGADSSMSQAAGEVEQGSLERRLKAPGPAGAGSSILGGLCTETFSPRVGPPTPGGGGGCYRQTVAGWALPRGPGQRRARTLSQGLASLCSQPARPQHPHLTVARNEGRNLGRAAAGLREWWLV